MTGTTLVGLLAAALAVTLLLRLHESTGSTSLADEAPSPKDPAA